MSRTVRHRGHAARVAAAATLVVLACYAACALALSSFVAHRLTSQADARLRARLATVQPGTLAPGQVAPVVDSDGDLDDAPLFLWYARGHRVETLTSGAPALAPRRFGSTPFTVTLDSTPFRLDALRTGGAWVVAGQSVGSISRVLSTLLLPEILFGALLGLATFAGALAVGLRAQAPLRAVRQRQAEFTADASHELRTPLSVLEAEVDLALRRVRTTGEYQAVLHRIGDEGRRLHHIVDDLLWLARLDSGQPSGVEDGPTDVAGAAVAGVARFGALAEQHDVQLDVTAGRTPAAMVDISPDWLDRLIGVLVDNAIKYVGTGGRVAVAVVPSANRVLLRVDDSGPGIPVEQRGLVFDRFRRATATAGGAGGAGLGLAIGDSVVRLTGGTWHVGNAPLGGARFQVDWRRAAERAPTTVSSYDRHLRG